MFRPEAAGADAGDGAKSPVILSLARFLRTDVKQRPPLLFWDIWSRFWDGLGDFLVLGFVLGTMQLQKR